MAQQSKINFYGGAGSVTGSNFMLDSGGKKILIDCGLFQGEHAFDNSNWEPFAFDPKEISILINTHAHIDHIGRIPKLVKDGYRGIILSTEATKALAEPMLLDAMELNKRDAQKHNREPLYSEDDIAQAMQQWETCPYHTPQDLGDGISMEFLNSGHILGSAMAKFTRKGRSIVFTGDLGGGNSPLLSLAEEPLGIQYLLMESVYGDKKREQTEDKKEILKKYIDETIAKNGTLLIPAFSTERTQDLLFDIRELMLTKRIPSVPVFVDSPLAEKITSAYEKFPQYFSPEIEQQLKGGEHIFSFPELHFVHDHKESESLYKKGEPKIILAGSGMSNGGRVLGHEREILPDPDSTLLIVGFQAAGSLGRRLIEGATKAHIGEDLVPVNCRVATMYGYSAHMDSEQLLDFVSKASDSLEEVFVTMGEPASAGFLAQRIRDYLGLRATSPEAGQTVAIQL